MSKLCGLRSKSQYKPLPEESKSKQANEYERPHRLIAIDVSAAKRPTTKKRESAKFQWSREDQLSVILELLEGESRRNTPNWEKQDSAPGWKKTPRLPKRTRFVEHVDWITPETLDNWDSNMSRSSPRSSPRSIPPTPRPIEPPPTDLESISRIDASLVFEHFTIEDAWELGSALRNRLLPIRTPVVIDISLANQNQTIFHTATHSGVMPDNESWVARKRKTVLRWGVSTWYMHCKFDGDEVAFREKYGLGINAGEYAIHGGGIPIRVTGVEGVVAVVVVSGLKQHEDHAVIVEVIRDLYY